MQHAITRVADASLSPRELKPQGQGLASAGPYAAIALFNDAIQG